MKYVNAYFEINSLVLKVKEDQRSLPKIGESFFSPARENVVCQNLWQNGIEEIFCEIVWWNFPKNMWALKENIKICTVNFAYI